MNEGQRRVFGVNVNSLDGIFFLWVDLVETEMENVEARLSVPFLPGEQVVDN